MKYAILAIALFCVQQNSFSQTVSADSIQFYEGKEITVCSKVIGTFKPKGEKKPTYINFGKPYPNSTFTVVIFDGDLTNFSYSPVEFLKDKNICITGIVKMYKDKPELIVKYEEQIKVE